MKKCVDLTPAPKSKALKTEALEPSKPIGKQGFKWDGICLNSACVSDPSFINTPVGWWEVAELDFCSSHNDLGDQWKRFSVQETFVVLST